jgi:hypothetical protein
MVLKWMSMSSLCVTLLVGQQQLAAEEAAVEADFLEFLGSLDSDDTAWAELLATAAKAKAESAEPEEEAQTKQVEP